jgi:hypothetical protein
VTLSVPGNVFRVMRAVIPVAALILLLAGCGGAARSNPENQAAGPPDPANGDVATVGSDTIFSADVDALLQEAAVSFHALGRPFPKVGTPYYLDLRDQAVQDLVEQSAREQEAVRLGAEVDPSDLERELEQVDRKAFREQARRSGLTMDRVSADLHGWLLQLALFRAVVAQKGSGETNVQAMKRWEQQVDEQIATAAYAPGWRPAERLRSPIPPELQNLPKAKGACDLKKGTFTIREVAAHGCVEDWGVGIPGADGTPCPEIPIDDFAVEGLSGDPTYSAYESTLMDSAPSCVPYPSTTYTVETGKGPCFPSGPDDPCTDGRLVQQTWITNN